MAGYYGNISQIDSYVGRVYDAVCDLGLDSNTIVVYTSDHGEMAGAHRMWTKHNMYEQSVGVPLIISTPERRGSSERRSELVELTDLFPTLVELCGFRTPAGLHGRSFARLVQGRSYRPREFVFAEYYFCHNVFTRDDRYVGKPPMLMVRTERWKLVHLSWSRSELYDVARDPGEFHNRIDDFAMQGVVQQLTKTAYRMLRLS